MNLEIGTGQTKIHSYLKGEYVIHVDINPASYHLEALADGQFLPFNNKVFENTYCAHVLEHVFSPGHFLKELERVTKNKIVIKVPNGLFYVTAEENETHLFSWTSQTLEQLLKTVFSNATVISTYHTRYVKGEPFKNFVRFLKVYFLRTQVKSNELTAVIKNVESSDILL